MAKQKCEAPVQLDGKIEPCGYYPVRYYKQVGKWLCHSCAEHFGEEKVGRPEEKPIQTDRFVVRSLKEDDPQHAEAIKNGYNYVLVDTFTNEPYPDADLAFWYARSSADASCSVHNNQWKEQEESGQRLVGDEGVAWLKKVWRMTDYWAEMAELGV